jgi:hypothetical protein
VAVLMFTSVGAGEVFLGCPLPVDGRRCRGECHDRPSRIRCPAPARRDRSMRDPCSRPAMGSPRPPRARNGRRPPRSKHPHRSDFPVRRPATRSPVPDSGTGTVNIGVSVPWRPITDPPGGPQRILGSGGWWSRWDFWTSPQLGEGRRPCAAAGICRPRRIDGRPATRLSYSPPGRPVQRQRGRPGRAVP